MNDDFPFYVVEEKDGSMTLHWDSKHPATSVFNAWTEQDFIDMLVAAATDALEKVKQAT